MIPPPAEPAGFRPGDSIFRPPVAPGAARGGPSDDRSAGGVGDVGPGAGVLGAGSGGSDGRQPGSGPQQDAATFVLHGSAPGARAGTEQGVPRASRRLPGGLVAVVATLVVIAVALIEVVERGQIGQWTGIALIAMSAIAVLITRPGDRSIPAMMPPLAFLAAVVIAGQPLVNDSIDDRWQRQAVMIGETLGENAAWVVAATATAVLLALIGHLLTRRSRRQAV